MLPSAQRFFILAFMTAAAGLLSAGPASVFAQAAAPEASRGAPQDWSHKHLLYTNPDTRDEAARKGTLAFERWKQMNKDPRFATSAARKARLVQTSEHSPISPEQRQWSDRFRRDPPPAGSDIHRDWSNVLGGATGVGKANVYPAKFGPSFTTADCANDFVVYTTASSGATSTGTGKTRNGTFTANPTAGQTVTITHSGVTLTLVAANSSLTSNLGLNFEIGSTFAITATNLANAIARNGGTVGVTATNPSSGVVTVTAITTSTAGTTSLASTLTNPGFTWAGTTLSGGAGTAGQPTIVAFNQLYSSCGTTSTQAVPATFWSYNTGAAAFTETSPVLSSDGTQVAFIQRTGSIASLVLLKWASGGTGTLGAPTDITAAGTTTNSVSPANYRACTAPCMTVNALSGNPNNTNSSPFYDYLNDTLYVGDNSGKLHKFTNVFGDIFGVPTAGTPAPAEVVSTGTNVWPAVISSTALTSPVYDNVTGNIFVGSTRTAAVAGTGALHAVDQTIGSGTGGITTSAVLFQNSMTGAFDGPIVDSTTGKVYVFVGDYVTTAGTGAVYQFAAATSLAPASQTPLIATVGTGAILATTMYAGTFDDTYYAGSGNTGFMYVCGTRSGGSAGLYLYRISMAAFAGAAARGTRMTNSATANCSPVTEVKNGADDYLFVSVSASGNDAKCPGSCVYSFNLNGITWGTTTASAGIPAPGGASGIIVDNISSTTGASQVYYSTLTSPGNAIQASQAALQ